MEAAGEAQGTGCRVDEAQRPGRAAVVCQQSGANLCRDRGSGRVPHGFPSDRHGTNRRETSTPRRMAIPRRFAIAAKEVTVEQYQRFLKLGGTQLRAISFQPTSQQVQPRSQRTDGWAPDWYTAARLLQLAERARGLAKEHWCYHPNEAGAVCRGDEDSRRVLKRPATDCPPRRNGNMPAGQVRLPADIMVIGGTALGVCLVSSQLARSMPGRAGACSQTNWDCLTCWGTCMNGARSSYECLPDQQRRGYTIDDMNISRIYY